eukprot:s2078_g8.t1
MNPATSLQQLLGHDSVHRSMCKTGMPKASARTGLPAISSVLNDPRTSKVAIEWLEPLDPNVKELEPSGDDGTMVLPVFPLGGPFMPYSKQKLNIFEPRYRELYDHILLSGSRRFVVTSVDPRSPADLRLATAGVVFYLDDLQEEMTQDQVKYVCDHTVIGRVRIKRVLNPSSWFDRSTYLRAETEAIEDSDGEADCWKLEGEVMDFLRKLVPLYDELKKPCYRADVLNNMNSSRSENGLWSLSEMWIQLLQAHMRSSQAGFERQMQEIVKPYLKPDAVISIDDLPADARAQIEQLRGDYIEQVKSAEISQLEFAQKMIQSDTHQGRLEYFKDILDEEYRWMVVIGCVTMTVGANAKKEKQDAAAAMMRHEIGKQCQAETSPHPWRVSGSPRRTNRQNYRRGGRAAGYPNAYPSYFSSGYGGASYSYGYGVRGGYSKESIESGGSVERKHASQAVSERDFGPFPQP